MMQTWDCFLLNDELDMLEFRLRQLAPVVDRFVIVEAKQTFRGRPKVLHFYANARRFDAWSDKIVHVVAELPGPPADHPERERAQRAAILDGLAGVEPDDLVLLGDVDEVPRAEVVTRLKGELVRPTRLTMAHSMHAANYRVPEDWILGTKAGRGRHLDCDEFDNLIGREPFTVHRPDREWMADAGWHLAYLGGPAAVRAKLGDFSHPEYDIEPLRRAEHLERCVEYGVEFVGRFLLEPLPQNEFDPLLSSYFAFAPDHFQVRPLPALPWRLAFRAWARFRTQKLPYSVVQRLEGRMRLTLLTLGPPLVLLDIVMRFARRYRVRHRLLSGVRLRPAPVAGTATPHR